MAVPVHEAQGLRPAGTDPERAPARAAAGTTRLAQRARWPLVYLAAIAAAELITSFVSPWPGLLLHVAILVTLLLHAGFGPSAGRPLLLALVLVPLARIASLALPPAGLHPVAWYLLGSLPLFVAALSAARLLGLTPGDLGLRPGRLPLQVAIGLLGLPLGLLEYLILRPAPLLPDLAWSTLWLPALVLLVTAGLLEELLFRGVLQATARAELGTWGLVYVSATAAVLHLGSRSLPDVLFVVGVGLLFAWFVLQGGSLLGVALAHGLASVILYLVLPLAPWPGLGVASRIGTATVLPAVTARATVQGVAAPTLAILTLVAPTSAAPAAATPIPLPTPTAAPAATRAAVAAPAARFSLLELTLSRDDVDAGAESVAARAVAATFGVSSNGAGQSPTTLVVELLLEAPSGEIVAESRYTEPFSASGQVARSVALVVPQGSPAGSYTVQVSVMGGVANGGGTSRLRRALQVRAPAVSPVPAATPAHR